MLRVADLRANPVFAGALLVQLLVYSAAIGSTFLFSIYLQVIKGFSPLETGQVLIVGPVLMAIVAPIVERKVKIARLIGLGAVAGGPTIPGCWIGAFTYSQVWALLFLGMGAGAIVQVIGAIVGRRPLAETLAPANVFGLVFGYLLMYGTGLMVGAA